MRRFYLFALVSIAAAFVSPWPAEELLFLDPQVGEKLVPLESLRVIGDLADQQVDVISDAKGSPVLLIFVHQARGLGWFNAVDGQFRTFQKDTRTDDGACLPGR